MKKIFFVLPILFFLLCLISLLKKKPAGDFSFLSGPAVNASQIDKKYIVRTFSWKNLKKEALKTTLKIPVKELKKEIKKFGIVKGMLNPRYLKKQGFKRLGEEYVVDYREVYRRNKAHFMGITNDLAAAAKIGKNRNPLVDFLCFTQQIEYQIPPKILNGRYIREFYTPLQCLEKKKGDCDTKSVLLAEFLGAIDESPESLAVLILKGHGIFHAILAIKRKPLPGTLKLFFQGKGYFMPLETSGPGWMPGFVGRNTFNCLKAGRFRFEPLN